MQGGYQGAEFVDRIGHSAAVMAGMEVLVGTGHRDLEIGQAAHPTVDRRHFLGDHSRVRNQYDIGLQQLCMVFYPLRERGGTDFFLSFEDEFDIVL